MVGGVATGSTVDPEWLDDLRGGHGELVQHPAVLHPALLRALASGKPAVANMLTDPEVVYPQKAVLVERIRSYGCA